MAATNKEDYTPGFDPTLYSYACPHGVQRTLTCHQCWEQKRLEAREEKLYATLDKLADAVNRLSNTL